MDTHRDQPRIFYPYPDIPCRCPNVATASLCDGECDARGYIVNRDCCGHGNDCGDCNDGAARPTNGQA